MEDSNWTEVKGPVFVRATKIVMKKLEGVKRIQAREVDERMKEAITEESKVNEEELIPLDSDIESMDLWTYEKIKLQIARNANKKDFSLDELIVKVTPSVTASLTDLF